jgi:hypothetical protein
MSEGPNRIPGVWTVSVLATLAMVLVCDAALSREKAGAIEHAFVITTDYYSAGYYSAIEIPPPHHTMPSIAPVSTDAVAYYDVDEDMIFVVNRFQADNIQIVENDPLFSTIGQYSVGNGSNPHDIRLADNTKAYVSRYEWRTLLICDPYTGDSLGVIDLSPFADDDGIPEMDRMEIVGDRLFVTLNSIDRATWLPDGPGKIAVVDVTADTLVDCDVATPGTQPIVLSLPDPYTELRYDRCRDELYVGCIGVWGLTDGGVEMIDPQTLESKRVLITETELAGDISDVALAPGGGGYAVVLDAVPWPDNFARLVRFDAAGAVTDTLFRQTSGFGSSLAGIEINRQMELYLCDRDLTHPGVRIYDIISDTQVAKVDVGLPPFDVTFLQTPFASVDGAYEAGTGGPGLTSCPNPFVSETTITLSVPIGSAPFRYLVVYDGTGRKVRTLAAASADRGTFRATWDGTDDSGRQVAPGVYFFGCGLGTPGGKVLLLR